MRRMATWGLVLAVVLAGAGCSDDGGDDDAGPSTTEEATTTAATASPCPLVTTEAVSEAFGLTVELLEGGDDACDFVVGDGATLLVTAGQADGTREEDCAPDSIVPAEAGDVAWACLVGDVPTGVVLEGEATVSVRVTGQVAAPQTRDALATLLPQVSFP